jgi:hypothetical protein
LDETHNSLMYVISFLNFKMFDFLSFFNNIVFYTNLGTLRE